jgi:hypothetical protein
MYAEMMGLLEDKGGLSTNDAFMIQSPIVGRVIIYQRPSCHGAGRNLGLRPSCHGAGRYFVADMYQCVLNMKATRIGMGDQICFRIPL